MSATPHRILCATDFSPTGERAQRAAFALARRFAADLHLLHVQVLLDDPHLAEERRDEIQRLLATADRERRLALEAAAAGHTDPLHCHVVPASSAADGIVTTCTDLGCDLIVIGTHGRRGLSHLLLGSVAERVVRTAPVPVLTVRQDGLVPEAGIARILVPHDFSEHSAAAVRVAAAWAGAVNAELTLLHVVEPIVYPEFHSADLIPDTLIGRLRDRSQSALDEAAAGLLGGVRAHTRIVVGRAGDSITAEAQPGAYDLVVMGTRGLSAIEHLLLGSVAESVLRRCPVPLLTVRK
jgi:nucleotide-binding universal stress UspA family protein